MSDETSLTPSQLRKAKKEAEAKLATGTTPEVTGAELTGATPGEENNSTGKQSPGKSPDDIHVQSIRDGKWREVIAAIGSEEYNRLRLIALR